MKTNRICRSLFFTAWLLCSSVLWAADITSVNGNRMGKDIASARSLDIEAINGSRCGIGKLDDVHLKNADIVGNGLFRAGTVAETKQGCIDGPNGSISSDGAFSTSLRKASPKKATKISGTIYASNLAENDDIVLTGNTVLSMNTDLTLTSISGDYSLQIQGNHTLTVNNPDGKAIEVKSLNSHVPLNLTAKESAIHATKSNIIVVGNLTAETTGDSFYCIVGKNVTLTGGTMTITSVANAVVSYGNMNMSGNITATSTGNGSVAVNSRDGGNIIFGKGDYRITGAGEAIYSAGSISFPTTLVVMSPTDGRIYGNTIVDTEDNPAISVHIGYIPKITQNTLTTPNIVKYGEQLLIEGKIKAIGKTTYKLQECADGSTWRTIKSGTLTTVDARAGQTIQYKKVLAENGYEAYRQYRMIATYVTSGEADTTATHKIQYKYLWVFNGETSYYAAGTNISYQKPEDYMEYKISSALPVVQTKNGDYIDYTVPACNVWIDKVKTRYTVKFLNADYTLLDTQEVECGDDAVAPANPTMSGLIFDRWSTDFTNVHKNLNVYARYTLAGNYYFDVAQTGHKNERYPVDGFAKSTTRAMLGDSLTFQAEIQTPQASTLYYETCYQNADGTWTLWSAPTNNSVGSFTASDVAANKPKAFTKTVSVAYDYYNERAFSYGFAFRFYIYCAGERIYSEPFEYAVYYPITINSQIENGTTLQGDPLYEELMFENSDGDLGFNLFNNGILPVRYQDTVRVYRLGGGAGAGMNFTTVSGTSLTSGEDIEGNAYFICPGSVETVNVNVNKVMVVFDGVYGNGYPKQLDLTGEGFYKVNGYYAEVVNCGGSVTMPEDPTVENGIFIGWNSWDPSSYDDLAYLNVPAGVGSIIGFTANFEYLPEVPQYTVRFYGKDGLTLLDTQTIDEGEDAMPPTAPEVSGWHFIGWDKPCTTITANTDITALYGEDIKIWTVTYKNWDGSDLGTEQVNDGESALGVDATREGYTFVKWRDYTTGDDVDMEHITANITVEAVFTETLHTVTYRVDGVVTYTIQVVHGIAASSIYYPYGTPIKEATAALVYTFDYWTPEVATITEDVTFDAVFMPASRLYTVVFQNWEHTLLDEQQVAYGAAAIAPVNPTREDYIFIGWDREFDNILADMTVTALFELKKDISLYEESDNSSIIANYAESGKTTDVKLVGRTLYKDGLWNTLCLPFDVADFTGTPLEGAKVEQLTAGSIDGTMLNLEFQEISSITAGVSYIVRWESGADVVEPVFENVLITNVTPQIVAMDDGVQFVGIYAPVELAANDKSVYTLGYDGMLNQPTEDVNVNALHAYIKLADAELAETLNDFCVDYGGGIVVTAIEEINANDNPNANGIYDLSGRKIVDNSNSKMQNAKLQRGIYIVNGKKVMIK